MHVFSTVSVFYSNSTSTVLMLLESTECHRCIKLERYIFFFSFEEATKNDIVAPKFYHAADFRRCHPYNENQTSNKFNQPYPIYMRRTRYFLSKYVRIYM